MVIGFYIASAIVGMGLILLSALGGIFGGHEVGGGDAHGDFSADHSMGDHSIAHAGGNWSQVGAKVFDKDLGKDVVGGSGIWIPFFSLRFWTYFTGGFGLVGSLLTFAGQGSPSEVLTASVLSGLFVGLVAAWVWRALTKGQQDTSTKAADFIGVIGTQSVSARGHDPGKVRVMVRGELIDLLAISDNGDPILAGTEVVVVGMDGDKARVASTQTILDQERQQT